MELGGPFWEIAPTPFYKRHQDLPHPGSKKAFLSQGLGASGKEAGSAELQNAAPSRAACGAQALAQREWLAGRRPWSPLPRRGRSVPSHTRHLCPGCSLCLECPLHLSFQGPPLSKGHPNTAFSPQAMGDEDFIHKEKGKKASLCLLQLPAVWSSLGGCRGRHLG